MPRRAPSLVAFKRQSHRDRERCCPPAGTAPSAKARENPPAAQAQARCRQLKRLAQTAPSSLHPPSKLPVSAFAPALDFFFPTPFPLLRSRLLSLLYSSCRSRSCASRSGVSVLRTVRSTRARSRASRPVQSKLRRRACPAFAVKCTSPCQRRVDTSFLTHAYSVKLKSSWHRSPAARRRNSAHALRWRAAVSSQLPHRCALQLQLSVHISRSRDRNP